MNGYNISRHGRWSSPKMRRALFIGWELRGRNKFPLRVIGVWTGLTKLRCAHVERDQKKKEEEEKEKEKEKGLGGWWTSR